MPIKSIKEKNTYENSLIANRYYKCDAHTVR